MADSAPPSKATDAVLVSSDPVPEDAQQVHGIDWAALPTKSRSIIADFVLNLSAQGFQSSAIGSAIRIINDMVCYASNAWSEAALTALLATVERRRDWRWHHHLPRLHVKHDLFWTA